MYRIDMYVCVCLACPHLPPRAHPHSPTHTHARGVYTNRCPAFQETKSVCVSVFLCVSVSVSVSVFVCVYYIHAIFFLGFCRQKKEDRYV
jgi:hypothetical protein